MPTSLTGFPQPQGAPGLGACGFLSSLACLSFLFIRSWGDTDLSFHPVTIIADPLSLD